jgi:flagellar motor switch protein FliM
MSEILSQEEIDALKEAVDQGEVETLVDAETKGTNAESYDFFNRSQQLVSRLPGLKVLYTGFAGYIQNTLAAVTRNMVRTELSSVQQLRAAEMMQVDDSLSCLCSVKLPNSKQPIMFVLDSVLLLSFIDALCGGAGRPVSVEEKQEMGPIEQRLARRLAEETTKCLEQAWQPVSPVRMELHSIEYKLQVVTFLPAQEVLEVAVFQVLMEEVQGELTVGLPHGLIESFRTEFLMDHLEGESSEDGQWAQTIAHSITQVAVDMSVELAQGRLSLKEFFDLKTGDVVYLDPHPEDGLLVNVEGIPKYLGMAGTVKNSQAVRITSRID